MVLLLLAIGLGAAEPPIEKPGTAKDALQPFQLLIGAWKGAGVPEGTRDEQAAGAWTETFSWKWHFTEGEPCLAVAFEKGKFFTEGELRFTPNKELIRYTLKLTLPDKSNATFSGGYDAKNKSLILDRIEGPAGEEQRLVFSLLRDNRYLYRLEARPAGTTVAFTRRYAVGATKEGIPFADAPKGPECIVSGGLGTIKVSHQGKEYWVCCSGCRDEFRANPEKYIKEFLAKTKKQ